MNEEAVQIRLQKCKALRYGVSLVAGCPFPDNFVEAAAHLQNEFKRAVSSDVIMVDPMSLHVTVLRSKSSAKRPHSLQAPGESFIANINIWHSSDFEWGQIQISDDGAIRVPVIESREFCKEKTAQAQGSALEERYGFTMRSQQNLYSTLGTCSRVLNSSEIEGLEQQLTFIRLPRISISTLRLVFYEDLMFKKMQILYHWDLTT